MSTHFDLIKLSLTCMLPGEVKTLWGMRVCRSRIAGWTVDGHGGMHLHNAAVWLLDGCCPVCGQPTCNCSPTFPEE